MRTSAIGLAFALSAGTAGVVSAAECPVEKFTVQDLERLNFAESLSLAVVDIMTMSDEQKRDTKFDLGAVVKGAPIKLGLDDSKAVSSYVKKNSSLSFSKDEQINYLRTNLSLVGAQMYEECLKRRTQNFSVAIPTNAYTEDAFILQIKWTPTYPLVDKVDATATVQVLNGTVDGKEAETKSVFDKKTASFIIRRQDTSKSLQIVPTVDGYDNGEDMAIVIPPIVKTNFVTQLRNWPGPNDEPFKPMCSDDGGGNCGSDQKERVRCIEASDSGMLLPSTIAIEADSRGAFYEMSQDSDYTKVCVRFGTYGVNRFGKKGYSALDSLAFTVREIVPGK